MKPAQKNTRLAPKQHPEVAAPPSPSPSSNLWHRRSNSTEIGKTKKRKINPKRESRSAGKREHRSDIKGGAESQTLFIAPPHISLHLEDWIWMKGKE
jgi:hypothetical protein